jgi:hypothetical protein
MILRIHLERRKVILTGGRDLVEQADMESPLERYLSRLQETVYDNLMYLNHYSAYSIDNNRRNGGADAGRPTRFAHEREKPCVCMAHAAAP